MISFNAQHTLKHMMQRSYCCFRGAMKKKHSLPIALALLFLGTATASADWKLENEQSQLSFISIKKGDIAEVHHFNQLEGTVDDKGNVQLTIQLASVATAIPIRDQRMQEMLFNTNLFPTAGLTATVDADQISMLKAGQMRVSALEGELSLHGQSSPVTAELIVARLTDDTLLVTSQKPLVVQAGDFDLVEGVEKLREIAGLPSISRAVPVSFVLTFKKN